MNKKTNKIETPNKVKKGFRLYACTVLCVALMLCFAVPTFAASDPIEVVNNLSSFIFGLIRAVGLIILGWVWCRSVCPSRAMTPASAATAF